MKTNMGRLDRSTRVLIAIMLAGLCAAGIVNGIIAVLLTVIASVFVITSLLSFCPIYHLLGKSTCRHSISKKEQKP